MSKKFPGYSVNDSLSQALGSPYSQMSLLANNQGMGVPGYDKSVGTQIVYKPTLTRCELRALYRNNAIVQRIIDYTGNVGTRRWLEPLHIADDKESDTPDTLKSYWKELNVRKAIKWRDHLARQFGGAVIFIGVDDGTEDLAEPLNVDGLKSINDLMVFDRWEMTVAPSEVNSIDPEFYIYYPSVMGDRVLDEGERLQNGVRVHSSRLLRQDGVKLPRLDMQTNDGWGDSVLQRFSESLFRYEQNQHAVTHMLQSHDIFLQQISGLSEIMAQKGGLDDVVALAMENWRMLSMYRTMIQDGDRESSSYVSHSFGGVADVVRIGMEDLTAAAGVPWHVIWGAVGKAGLTDSGGAEKQAENDLVAAYQYDSWLPDLEYLAELTFAADDFEGEEPDDWELKFKHLHEPTELDMAELKERYARIDSTNIASGILTGEEARGRQTTTEFQTDLVLPEELPEELQTTDPLAGLGLEGEPGTEGSTQQTEGNQPPPTEEPGQPEQQDQLSQLQLQDSQDFVDLVEQFDTRLMEREEETSEAILSEMDRIGRQYDRLIKRNYREWGQRNLLLPAQKQALVDEIKPLFRFDVEMGELFLAQVDELYRVADKNGEDMAFAYMEGLEVETEPTGGLTQQELNAVVVQSADELKIQGEKFAETAAATVTELIALRKTAEEASRAVRDKLTRSQSDVTTAVEGHSVGMQSGGSVRASTANGIEFVQLFTEGDDRVCPYCAARAYNVYRAGEITLGLHLRCRCKLLPYRDDFLQNGLSAEFFAEDRQRQINNLGNRQPNPGVSPSEKFRGLTNPPTPVRRFTQTGDSSEVTDELQSVPLTRPIAEAIVAIIEESAGKIRSLDSAEMQYDPDTDQLVVSGVFTGALGPFDYAIDTGKPENEQIQYQLQNPDQAEQLSDAIEEALVVDEVIADAKKCTKGFSCGNSCQAMGRACLVGLTAEQKKQVNALKGAARAALSQELQEANRAAETGGGGAAVAEPTPEPEAQSAVPNDVDERNHDYYRAITEQRELTDEETAFVEQELEDHKNGEPWQLSQVEAAKRISEELGVTEAEGLALKQFLGNRFREMNAAIYNPNFGEGDDDAQIYEKVMATNRAAVKALQKVEAINAGDILKDAFENSEEVNRDEEGNIILGRGVNILPSALEDYIQSNFRNQLDSGQPHTNMLLMSTAYATDSEFSGNVRIQIQPKLDRTGKGHLTDQFKNGAYEAEVTYEPGTQFNVKSINPIIETRTVRNFGYDNETHAKVGAAFEMLTDIAVTQKELNETNEYMKQLGFTPKANAAIDTLDGGATLVSANKKGLFTAKSLMNAALPKSELQSIIDDIGVDVKIPNNLYGTSTNASTIQSNINKFADSLGKAAGVPFRKTLQSTDTKEVTTGYTVRLEEI